MTINGKKINAVTKNSIEYVIFQQIKEADYYATRHETSYAVSADTTRKREIIKKNREEGWFD